MASSKPAVSWLNLLLLEVQCGPSLQCCALFDIQLLHHFSQWFMHLHYQPLAAGMIVAWHAEYVT
jgi:uncharacterized phage-associated protein